MFCIRIAELEVGIEHRFEDILRCCRAYLSDSKQTHISVCVTDETLAFERKTAGDAFSDGYLETLAVYRAIGEQLPLFDGFIFHSAVIELDGKAYAFAAKSGTGKSTHIRHWRSAFGHRVSPVNGDKPIFRYMDGVLHACGTPWAGKEGWQRNVCVPLSGICFLERGEVDRIAPISLKDALPKALSQIYLPADRTSAEQTLVLLDRALHETPLWYMQCTDNIHAAQVACDAMLAKR